MKIAKLAFFWAHLNFKKSRIDSGHREIPHLTRMFEDVQRRTGGVEMTDS